MTKTRKPVFAVLAVAAAAAVVCATAAAAFAGIIETPARGLVYDDTYGVIYEDYAMMMNYEESTYKDGDIEGTVYTVEKTDIVDSMGNVTLSMSDETGLEFEGFLRGYNYSTYKESCVQSKLIVCDKDGNLGIFACDGTCLIKPANYKSFSVDANELNILGFVYGENGASIDVYDPTATSLIQTLTITDRPTSRLGYACYDSYIMVAAYDTFYSYLPSVEKYYTWNDGKYVEIAKPAELDEAADLEAFEGEASLAAPSLGEWGKASVKCGVVNETQIWTYVQIRYLTDYDYTSGSQLAEYGKSYVADGNGNAITIGGYTLAVPEKSYGLNYRHAHHNDEDFYFATDANGKYGAIDSKGNVLIPFEYEGIYECVTGTESDYVIAKKDGAFYFVKAVADPEVKAGENPVQGEDRYETAAKIATTAYPEGAAGAVVSTGMNFPDALAASSLAGALDWPIVLTNGTAGSLDKAAKEAITDLGATEFVVVGGVNAVSQGIFDELDALGTVSRISGDDRFKTAEAIYAAAPGAWSETCIIATGHSYPDALSISGYANSTKTPIFLSNPETGLTAETLADIKAGGFKSAVIVGGKNAVPEVVEQQLAGCGLGSDAVNRLEGTDRYATSAKIASFALDNGFKPDGACIATGANFPDALAGGVLAGRLGTVMLLGSDSDTSAFSVLNGKDVKSLVFLGGENAVTPAMRAAAKTAAGL